MARGHTENINRTDKEQAVVKGSGNLLKSNREAISSFTNFNALDESANYGFMFGSRSCRCSKLFPLSSVPQPTSSTIHGFGCKKSNFISCKSIEEKPLALISTKMTKFDS